MDYDQTPMPATYDAARGYTPGVMDFWLRTIASALPDPRRMADIVDLGCGTGRYSAALATHFNARVTGLDPSEKMLTEARKKETEQVRFMQGSGEIIPLADQSADLVFISMVFHHFGNPPQAAAECHRVLRPGGVVCLRTAVNDRAYPYSPFFPGMKLLLDQHLQSLAFIETTFLSAGFQKYHHEVIRSEVAANWTLYAEKVALRVDSVMIRLPDHEFTEGLAALRAHAETAPPTEPVIEPIDLLVFRKD